MLTIPVPGKVLLARLMRRFGRTVGGRADLSLDTLTATAGTGAVAAGEDHVKRLDVAFCDVSPDEAARESLQKLGQHMARQEQWSELSNRIRKAENERATTPGGMPVADLLAFGARADVVQAAEHMIDDGAHPDDPRLLAGIDALEEVLGDNPGDYAIALIVAHTHVDMAWTWRGAPGGAEPTAERAQAFARHLLRATEILDPHDGIELNSPGVAAARCALLAGSPQAQNRVADDYEDLIDLDPHNHRHMRAMGTHLLPKWFGSYAQLELEARRTASRTQDVWGDAAYSWVMFDAIAHDDTACARLDVEFFIDGMEDILERRRDQATVNLLAAYCATVMKPNPAADPEVTEVRAEVHRCAEWIVREHLTEVHPLIWAHAAEGFDNAARVPSLARFAARGRAEALKVIGRLFSDDLDAGRRVVFTPQGPRVLI